MRSVLVTFLVYLAVITAGLALYIGVGFARNADNDEPAAAVKAFASALEQGHGGAACGLLSADAHDSIEKERKKPCAQGIVEMKDDVEPGADPQETDIAER